MNQVGETEITTEEGIEVFQNEKYYILKKNVIIKSNNFNLSADLVKAYFDLDLYDIKKIESDGNVNFKSLNGIIAKGEKLIFIEDNEKISVLGRNSYLMYKDLEMKSDKFIEVNNMDGKFKLEGKNSEFKTLDLHIIAEYIDGSYSFIDQQNQISKLQISDSELSNIVTNDINMFSTDATYSKESNIIELFENVKIIRNKETVTGDYAKVNTLDQSYKIKSNSSNKVKILINED